MREYLIVAFRSRSESLEFRNALKDNGFYAEIVNTPKEAGVGCGLSVKIDPRSLSVIRKVVFSKRKSSFAGFFSVREENGKRKVRSI